MNKLNAILFTILFFSNCQKYIYIREQQLHESGKIHCGWYGKKTIAECRKTYPFSEAAKVVLISFPDYEISENEVLSKTVTVIDTVVSPTGEKLPMPRTYTKYLMGKEIPVKITKPILDTLRVFDKIYSIYEIKELNQQQIDSLSHLCVNYTTNIPLRYSSRGISCCYKPRNAIIFYDKYNQPIMDFEICFECTRS